MDKKKPALNSSSRSSLSHKLSLASGPGALAVAAALTPANCDAAIVESVAPGSPISPPNLSNGATPWDVDGNNTYDLFLRNKNGSKAYFEDYNGARLAWSSLAGVAKLNAGVSVGNLRFPANSWNNYVTSNGNIAVDMGSGWSVGGTGFFGFKFSDGDNTHYGWGELNISGSPAGAGFSILRAYYEDAPATSIAVGAVPEPSSLALLACGAAAALVWRKRLS